MVKQKPRNIQKKKKFRIEKDGNFGCLIQQFSTMSYKVKHLDPVAEEPEIEMEAEGTETDADTGKASDETLSFLRWKLTGDVPNSNPAQHFYKKGAARYFFSATCSLLPWIINFILAITVVVLAVRLASQKSLDFYEANLIPQDMLYSEFFWTNTKGKMRCRIPQDLADCNLRPVAALAEEAVEYRIETTYASEDYPDSEYQGWPNAMKDQLWNKYEGAHDLCQGFLDTAY